MLTTTDLEKRKRLLHQINTVSDTDYENGIRTGIGPLKEVVNNAAFFGEKPVDFINTENTNDKRNEHSHTWVSSFVKPSRIASLLNPVLPFPTTAFVSIAALQGRNTDPTTDACC